MVVVVVVEVGEVVEMALEKQVGGLVEVVVVVVVNEVCR